MTNEQRQFVHDIIAELLQLPKASVVWANQDHMPQLTKSYATIRLYNARREAAGELRPTDTDGIVNVIEPTAATLEVQYTDRLKNDPCEVISNMILGLKRPTVVDRCQAARVAFFDAGNVQDISFTLGSVAWEHRAAVDIRARYMAAVQNDVGYIDEVHAGGVLTGPVISGEITVDLPIKRGE